MNADLSWGEVRWRDPQSLPPANNSISINMGFHGDRSSWHSRSRDYADHELHAPVAKAAAHMNASQSFFNHTRPTADHHDSPDDTQHSSDPPQKLGPTTQRNTEDSWTGSDSGQRDQRLDSGYRLSERQPMLDSSTSRGLPSISEDRRTSPARDHSTNTNNRLSPQAHTSLPSFAVFQRSASCADGSTADLPRIPSPGRASCRGCAERDSSIEDIAIAVSGIEEILKLHSPESITKRPDGVQSDSSSIARWVLDRLREVRLKVGLQDSQSTLPAGYGYRSHQKSDHQSSGLTRSLTPPSSSKRQSDWPEVDETHLNKRQRISRANNEPLGCDATLRYVDDQRRASDSFQKNEPYRTYSPSHSDSWVSSGRPQQQSPSVTGRSLRPLPSPSSLANTSLKAPWTGSIAPSGSSPTISDPAPCSIHTASVSSAASQHIADLQHQITVKSLGLQTLQSEYTSLLQKFQRDRLRSQTLEKKAVAAEQEVNELTTKNEELAEQVKLLETQTEQQEKKREAERSEASREKDQWGKMLEMSGRLQVKGTEQRQKLVRERDDLLQRVRMLENDAAGASCRSGECSQEKSQSQEHGSRQADGGSIEEANAVVASLKKDNDNLQARTVMLRSALERIEGQYTDILNKRRELLGQEAQVPAGIARVLKEDSDAPGLKGHGRFQHFNWHDHSPDEEAQTRSADVSSPPQQANTNASSDSAFTNNASAQEQEQSLLPSIASQSDNAMLRQPTSLPHDTTSATSKEASPPRLRAVNLPKWQPPNTSALHTGSDHLANNQRRASGPSTPYPGSEVNLPQWQPAKPAASSPPSTHQTSASSPPQTLLSAFAAAKTPGLDYSPQFVPSTSQAAGEKSDTFSSSAASSSMPPPPRPGAAAASWRAS